MGSGLVKCFITNQTIPENFPIMIFPIVNQSTYSKIEIIDPANNSNHSVYGKYHSTVYANWLYDFTGFSFDGLMKDYAQFELNNNANNMLSLKTFLSYLYNQSCITIQGENQYHDQSYNIKDLLKTHNIEWKIENKDFVIDEKSLNMNMDALIEELVELTSKNRIFIKHYNGDFLCLHFAVCLKSTYNLLIENKKESFIEKIQSMYIDNQKPVSFLSGLSLRSLLTSSSNCTISPEFTRLLIQTEKELPISYNKEEIKKVIKKLQFLYDFTNFQRNISHLNLTLQPISGYYQDYSNDIGTDFLTLVAKANKDIDNFLKESNDDEDEELDFD